MRGDAGHPQHQHAASPGRGPASREQGCSDGAGDGQGCGTVEQRAQVKGQLYIIHPPPYKKHTNQKCFIFPCVQVITNTQKLWPAGMWESTYLNLISEFFALHKAPFIDFLIMQLECAEKHIFSGISDYFRLFFHRCSYTLETVSVWYMLTFKAEYNDLCWKCWGKKIVCLHVHVCAEVNNYLSPLFSTVSL